MACLGLRTLPTVETRRSGLQIHDRSCTLSNQGWSGVVWSDPCYKNGFWRQVGDSAWTAAIPLESGSDLRGPDQLNTKPVLIRARIPSWGTLHEVVARLELVGGGFARTMVSDALH